MKFTIKKNELLKSLLLVGKIIPIKSSSPIYTNIKLSLDQEGLTLLGSNGGISIINKIPYFLDNQEIIRDYAVGSILINNSILTEITKKIDGEEITFEVLEDNIARIESVSTSYKLNCINADEYIDLDFTFKGVKVTLKAKDFADGVNQVAFAASIKNTKPILNGVNIEGSGGKINFVATDGARLAKKEVDGKFSSLFSTTIPSRTVQEIVRSITNEDDISLYINDNRLICELNNTLILSTLLADKYPNTKNIIPKNFFYTLEVNADDFLKTIDIVNVFSSSSNEKSTVIRANMSDSRVMLSCNSIQNGTSSALIDLFHFTGDNFEIGFNSDFVTSAIKALKSKDLIIKFQGEMKPFVVLDKNDDSVIQLLTPMRYH